MIVRRVRLADPRVHADGAAHPPGSADRAGGVIGPRAAWLARVVASGALDPKTGLLVCDLWDPIEMRAVLASDDVRAAELDEASGFRLNRAAEAALRRHRLTNGTNC